MGSGVEFVIKISEEIQELIQAEAETLQSEIDKLVSCIWNKEELSDCGRSLLLY
jgi:hypothetical protein